MGTSFPLNENDDVRAATCNCVIFASRFNSSSEMPSEKYSWSLPWLMSTNGSTAIELSLVAGCAGGVAGAASDAAAPVDTDAGTAASLEVVDPLRRGPKLAN